MERISREEAYMAIAMITAGRGTCMRRQVGAVITYNNRVISTGYNGVVQGLTHCSSRVCDLEKSCGRAVHAEANAISRMGNMGWGQGKKKLYVTTAPCFNCASLLVQMEFDEVTYLYGYRNSEGIKLLREAGVVTENMLLNPRLDDLVKLYNLNLDGAQR